MATVGSDWFPSGEVELLRDVPRFSHIQLLQGGPAWAMPSSTTRKAACTKRSRPGLGQSISKHMHMGVWVVEPKL